tara:strand:+ start:609 stop:1082 length:474 start_codon:yes stop_codon:yes gene_type:complete
MQTQTQTNAQTLADTLATSFETRERANGGTFHALKDDAPQWIADAVRAAHGDRLPCDWIYKQCDAIASDIRQAILHDDIWPDDLADRIRPEADDFTATLTAWLADDIRNLDYCNQWADEMGGTGDLCAMISGGQWLAKQEIAGAMIQAYLTELEAQE